MERSIDHGEVHSKAVEIGRKSRVPEAADRLAASNPDQFISSLVQRIKPEAAQGMADEEIVAILADHLWAGWLQVELNHAEQSANHKG